jgi:hypothetical protein
MGFRRHKLPQRVSDEGTQGTKMDKKRMQDRVCSFAYRQVHNDTSVTAILSKIAQITRDWSARNAAGQPIWMLGAKAK